MTRSWARNKPRLLIAAGIAVAAVAALVLARKGGDSGRDGRIGAVERIDLVQRVTITGTVLPRRRVVIMAPYNGYVHRVHVSVGQKVRKGDPVASVTQSLASLHEEVFPLRSPVDGVVVQVVHEEGENVREGDDKKGVIARIDDLGAFYVAADVPELDLLKMSIGQEVVVRPTAILEKTYAGVIEQISLAAVEKDDWKRDQNVAFPIRVRIKNPDERVRSGMSALVDVIAARREKALALAHEFVRKEGDKYYVILAGGGRRDITVGLQTESHFEVLTGVQQGEKVLQTDFLENAVED